MTLLIRHACAGERTEWLLDQVVAVCGHCGLSEAVAGVSLKKGETPVLDDDGHVVESVCP